MNTINLHIHSIGSDGILTGEEIIKKALSSNLNVISITDHDTTSEVKKIIDRKNTSELSIIPGVELTTEYPNGTCHILGYGINLDKIDDFSKKVNFSRNENAKKIIEKLNNDGFIVEYNEVLNNSSSGIISRRDIARELVKKKYFDNEDYVVELLFRKGKPYYIETKKNSIKDCISIIKESGGIPVIAHPWTLNLCLENLKKFLIHNEFEGIEVYNHNISEQLYDELLSLAIELDYYITCGTDYHGQKGLNDFVVEKEVDCSKILYKLGVRL